MSPSVVASVEDEWIMESDPGENPSARPALPQVKRNPSPPRSPPRQLDVEREWVVLESGVEMMYHATTAEEREIGWQRYQSAARRLKKEMGIRMTPTTEEVTAETVQRIIDYPPWPTPSEMAQEIADILIQKQEEARKQSAAAIAKAILEQLAEEGVILKLQAGA